MTTKIFIVMIIVAIVGGMFFGYMIGCYLLDRWIENGRDDVDSE